MFKPVAVWFHGVIVVHLKPFPSPSVLELTDVLHHPCDVLDHAVEGTWEGQFAQFGQALFDKRRSNHREGLYAVPVGDVLALKKKKGKAKHVIAVNVGDEHGAQVSGIDPLTSKASQGSGRCVDDVLSINQSERVVAAVREEGVPRSEHVNARGHDGRNPCAFLFSSVGRVWRRDARAYQG